VVRYLIVVLLPICPIDGRADELLSKICDEVMKFGITFYFRNITDLISLLVLFFLWFLLLGNLFKKAYSSVVSNLIRMKFGRIVLQANTARID